MTAILFPFFPLGQGSGPVPNVKEGGSCLSLIWGIFRHYHSSPSSYRERSLDYHAPLRLETASERRVWAKGKKFCCDLHLLRISSVSPSCSSNCLCFQNLRCFFPIPSIPQRLSEVDPMLCRTGQRECESFPGVCFLWVAVATISAWVALLMRAGGEDFFKGHDLAACSQGGADCFHDFHTCFLFGLALSPPCLRMLAGAPRALSHGRGGSTVAPRSPERYSQNASR